MATLRSMFADWEFNAKTASDTSTSNSSKITLDRERSLLTLTLQDSGYSTDVDLAISTEVKEVPMNVEWSKVEVTSSTPKNLSGASSTSAKLRLTDGVSQYHRDGVAWAVTVTSWSTPQVVNSNLSSWTGPKLGWIVNLATTDKTITPTVSRIRALHKVDNLNYFNDIVYDTVIAGLQSGIRPIAKMALDSDGAATIDLDDYELESKYVITAIDGVYNDTADPTHQSDILSSFDLATSVITLTGSPAPSDSLMINFIYAPQVGYQASQDYTEIATVPSIVFDSIEFVDLGEASTSDYIMDTSLTPPQAVILPAPRRTNVVFTLDAYAPLVSDLYLLQESVLTYLQENRVIKSAASGQEYTMRITSQFAPSGDSSSKDLHQSRMSFQVENAYLWLRPAQLPNAGAGTGFGIDKIELVSNVGQATSTLNIMED